MKMRTAVCLVVLLAACASPTAMLDERLLDCAPGADISVQAGVNTPQVRIEQGDDQLTLVVEVSNNSDEDLTVKFVSADQARDESAAYEVDRVRRTFDRTIAEGEDEVFELPLTGRPVRRAFSDPARRSDAVSLAVVVALTNGDSYRCYFSVQARY